MSYTTKPKIRDQLFYPYMGIVLVLVVTLTLVNWYVAANTMKTALSDYSRAMIRTASNSISYRMHNVNYDVFNSAHSSGLIGLLGTGSIDYETPQFTKAFYDLLYSKSYVTGLLYVDPSGTACYYSKGSLSDRDVEIARLESYHDQFADDLVGGLRFDRGIVKWRPGTKKHLCMIRPLIDKDDLKYLGRILVEIDAEFFLGELQDLRREFAFVIVVNSDGEILLGDDAASGYADYLSSAGRGGSSPAAGSLSRRYMIFDHYNPDGEIRVINFLPTSYFATRFGFAATLSVLISGAFLVLAFLSGKRVFDNMAVHVGQLLEGVRRISSGDLDYVVESRIQGELADLAGEVNKMGGKISLLMDKLKKEHNESMDNFRNMVESQYYALQAQLNPHFLYNALESINSLAVINKQYELSEILCLLADLLRENVRRKSKYVALADELSYMKNYLALYTKMYGSRVKAEFDFDPAAGETAVPTMALLPLVENALVHGVEKIEGMGMVRIATRAGEKEVAIDICDNGPGADAGLIERLRSGECLSQGTKKHCSSGLSGLLERLTLIYGAAYRLELDRTDDGLFRVRLTVPRGGAPA